MYKDKTLIACSVFKNEFERVIPEEERPDIVWLDASLHVNADLLEAELTQALEALNGDRGNVRILFGRACHMDMDTILDRFGVKGAHFSNCIEAFCGDAKTELEQNDTMIMTPGWVRAWPDMMRKFGYDETDLRMNMGRYERIVVLDCGADPLSEEEILEFFDLAQVPVEVQTLDLSAFKECALKVLDA